MTILQAKRTLAFGSSFLFLVLGLCVFAWGLRYKLSLYNQHHGAPPKVLSAKLLSRNERPETDQAAGLFISPGSLPGRATVPFLLAFVPPVLVQTSCAVLRRAESEGPSKDELGERTGLRIFFLRPPPSFLLS